MSLAEEELLSFTREFSLDRRRKEELFLKLKETSGRILSYPSLSIWSVHGGIEALIECIDNIFKHKQRQRDHVPDSGMEYWSFISCLRWLNPTLATEMDILSKTSASATRNEEDESLVNRGCRLFRKCLTMGNLSDCIAQLVGDKNVVAQHYDVSAFLSDFMFTSAMLACVQAVEKKSSAVLANISTKIMNCRDPSVMLLTEYKRIHQMKIMASTPSTTPSMKNSKTNSLFRDPLEHTPVFKNLLADRRIVSPHRTLSYNELPQDFSKRLSLDRTSLLTPPVTKQKAYLPDIVTSAESSKIIQESKASIKKGNRGSNSEYREPTKGDIVSKRENISTEIVKKSTSSPTKIEKQHRRCLSDMSLTEIRRMRQPYEPPHMVDYTESHPNKTALLNFLRNQDLATCADLQKENAHFHFSEMLITMMEETKCGTSRPDLLDSSTSSITSDATVTPFCSETDVEENHGRSEVCRDSLEINFSPECSRSSSSWYGVSEEENGDIGEVSDINVEIDLEENAFSVPERSGNLEHSEDVNKPIFSSIENSSAESIAIGLLLAFSGESEPNGGTDGMEWLVSEDDVPQQLLPFPESTSIDPDSNTDSHDFLAVPEVDGENSHAISFKHRIRGNEHWAPPRFQIIFNVHRHPKRAQAIANQKYMCAGCGTLVEKAFLKRFRYCEYIGKYFCTCCHDNSVSVIPARVFHNFDFKKYNVSNFSYELLRKIHQEPLFNIHYINPLLYSKSKSLSQSLELRIQLSHLTSYLRTCRNLQETDSSTTAEPEPLLKMMNEFPKHVIDGDVHVYSMEDLQMVKSGELEKLLKTFTRAAAVHVSSCEFCRAKGFVCELCGNIKDIIFPHQLRSCFQCPLCNACYHKKCFVAGNCPKCMRIASRRKLRETNSTESASE